MQTLPAKIVPRFTAHLFSSRVYPASVPVVKIGQPRLDQILNVWRSGHGVLGVRLAQPERSPHNGCQDINEE
jgi:hypothetical protein